RRHRRVIAGLAAAFRLQQAGVKVRVLEAANRAGGRMITETVGSYMIEHGTQAVTSTYPPRSTAATPRCPLAPRPTGPRAGAPPARAVSPPARAGARPAAIGCLRIWVLLRRSRRLAARPSIAATPAARKP